MWAVCLLCWLFACLAWLAGWLASLFPSVSILHVLFGKTVCSKFLLRPLAHMHDLLQTSCAEALFWHQIMGIFSISSSGHVVVADSCAVKTFSIPEVPAGSFTVHRRCAI